MADDDSNNALSCKVVLLGESGVGKTSTSLERLPSMN